MTELFVKIGKFLIKHKWLYYLLLVTWGLPVTLLGALVFLALCWKRHWIYNGSVVTIVEGNWGGFSLGFFSFVGSLEGLHIS